MAVNVLFESSEKEDILRKKIEYEIETISVIVVLRTAAELKQIIQNCPFSKKEVAEAEALNTEGESLYVSLLTDAPLQEKIEYLNNFKSIDEDYRIRNRDIYLLFRHSIRNSKLANNLQKLDVTATVRNWKTINKLHVLAKARAD